MHASKDKKLEYTILKKRSYSNIKTGKMNTKTNAHGY
jgi:hypothetical protein